MKKLTTRSLGLLLATCLLSGLLSGTARAAEYTIDPDHSTVGFKIKHLAISTVPGSFSTFTGSFVFDPANMKASKAEADIKVNSINTAQAKRDTHLRGEEFFDVKKFPDMKFVSREVTETTDSGFKVAGDLTIRGVTKPVVLDVVYGGAAKDPSGIERAAFTATTKLNRKDFGLTWNKVMEAGSLLVGEDVTVNIEIEGIKKS